MLSPAEATAFVSTAAKELDRATPGWAGKIDIGTLNIATSDCCIMGQLSEGGGKAWATFLGTTGLNYPVLSPAVFSCVSEDYPLLQDAWIAAIADRLIPASTSDLVQVPVHA